MRALIVPARVLFALIFVTAGLSHLGGEGVAYAQAAGVPLAKVAVPLSGLLALAGGLSIALGYRARLGGIAIALFLVPVTLSLHAFWSVSDPMMAQLQQAMFFKNVALLGGALAFTYFGAGAYSLDARRGTAPLPVPATNLA